MVVIAGSRINEVVEKNKRLDFQLDRGEKKVVVHFHNVLIILMGRSYSKGLIIMYVSRVSNNVACDVTVNRSSNNNKTTEAIPRPK